MKGGDDFRNLGVELARCAAQVAGGRWQVAGARTPKKPKKPESPNGWVFVAEGDL